MRASILCVTAALIAAGCSHSKEEETTTQELRQQQPPAAEAETQGGYTAASTPAEECPMQVTGTTLRTEDTSGGVALVFLTSGDVSELRQRVRHMADMHNRMQSGSRSMNKPQGGASKGVPQNSMPGAGNYETQGSGTPGGGTVGDQSTYGGGSMAMQPPSMQGGAHGMMPTATARAEDIDGGAQLILIATDPAQTDALRQSAREEAQDMAAGNCSMMQGSGGIQHEGHEGMDQEQMQQEQLPGEMQIPENTMPPNGMQNGMDHESGGY